MQEANTFPITIHDVPATFPATRDVQHADVLVYHREGRLPPLFVVRSWSREGEHFRLLAEQLGTDQPIYSIAPPDFATLEEYPSTSDAWCDFLMPRIRALDYHGEYVLAGWSFGGVLALELAERLRSAGDLIRLVILIDSRMPKERPQTNPGVSRPMRLHRFARHLLEYTEIETRDARIAYARKRLDPIRRIKKDRARRARRRAARKPDRVETSRSSRPVSPATTGKEIVTRWSGERMSFLQRTIHVAYLKYRRHPTSIPLLVLRTHESFTKSGRDPSLGWAPFALGRSTFDGVPGSHWSVFAPENISVTADKIQAALRSTWEDHPYDGYLDGEALDGPQGDSDDADHRL